MKLHDLVKGSIGIVNPSFLGSIFRSNGAVMNGTNATATYDVPEQIEMQVQSLSNNELRQVDFLNQQGEKKAVYLKGQAYGIDRVRGVGGDLLEFMGRRWLVVQRLEGWEGSDWCKVAVVAQLDSPQDDDAEIEDYVG